MRRWWPLVAVGLGAFMLLVDVTIVNVALPAMADELGTSFAGLQWVVDGYALALAALLLGTGTLADRLGHRRVYVGGLGLFGLASLGCALAPSTGMLITGRLLQGAGAAAMFATTLALLGTTYHGRDRAVAFGVWGAVNGGAAAAGPVVGGLLTEHLSWRWIFAVNVPVAALAVAITLWTVAGGTGAGRRRLDPLGIVTFTIAAAATTYGLIRGGEQGWTGPDSWAPLLVAAVALVGFVAVARRVAEPMLDLGLFRHRAFVGLLGAGALLSLSAWAMLPYASLWMQHRLGLGPVAAGLVILPMSLVSFVVPLVMGRFGHGVPARWSVAGGLLLVGVGDVLQARIQAGSGAGVLVPGMVCVGLGAGLALPPLSSALLGTVPRERAGMAGGALNAARQLGLALGVAVLGGIVSAVAPGGPAGPAAEVAEVAEVAAALTTSYLVAGGAGLVGAVLTVVLVGATAPSRADAPTRTGAAAAGGRTPRPGEAGAEEVAAGGAEARRPAGTPLGRS
ncbi:MFS transporter [Micromonospora sp. HM5-17]|uniref:MFS transporter n=1 Tax=Micromonospora sp. HM5-17 TaxID=2487710 RepID=UPI000F4975F3|nr:MFS transporter [Micromonospora sp. HM5-17]ROT33699.1 MFS transporter [Micromonospora sp. HM5-17]